MKRSLTAVLAVLTTVCGSTLAHADLNSLLGDWTAAASRDAKIDNGETDLTLVPAVEGTAEVDSQLGAGPRKATPNTLASIPAGVPVPESAYAQPSVLAAPVHHGGLQPNPYYTPQSATCQCDKGNCHSGTCPRRGCFGGGCGELVPRDQVCQPEGQSECRPHRRPLLPPPTTMLHLFRSKNTYSTVWAGYADETRERLRNRSPHLDGTWITCDEAGLLAPPSCSECGPACAGH